VTASDQDPSCRTFLVCFDSLESGCAALETALRLRAGSGARITLAAVAPPVGATADSFFAAGYLPRCVLEADAAHEAQGWLARLRDRLPPDVSVSSAVHTGRVPDVAFEVAAGEPHDAICVSERSVGRGRRGARRALRKLTSTGLPLICVPDAGKCGQRPEVCGLQATTTGCVRC
jgi:hypothetical protein